MEVKEEKYFAYDHVKLRDTGWFLPVVFSIDEGYKRTDCIRTKDGEYVVLIGVSDIKAEKKMLGYKRREDEEVHSILGFTISGKEEAELYSEFFKELADKIEPASGTEENVMEKESAKRLKQFIREVLKQDRMAYTLVITRETLIEMYKCVKQMEKDAETDVRNGG